MTETGEKVFLEIRIPRDSEETPEAAVALFANLPKTSSSFFSIFSGKKSETFSFEIEVSEQTIRFFAVLPKAYQTYFESQISAQYPSAIMIPSSDYLSSWSSEALSFGQMVFRESFYLPLRTYKDFKEVDPLSSVLGIMAKANANEKMLVQIVVSTAGSNWQSVGHKVLARGIPLTEDRIAPHPQAKLIESKINQVGFKTGVRLLVAGSTEEASSSLLRALAGSFGNFASGEGNSLRLTTPLFFKKQKLLNSIFNRSFEEVPSNQAFTILELATLFHLPSVSLSGIRNIAWGRQMTGEPPSNLPIALNLTDEEKQRINFFAKTEYKNKLCIFGIKKEDRRKHVYIIGKTGTGKSTLIANMAINDIRNGEGVAVIDPHGDLSELLLDYIPSFRINDVVYLDPSTVGRSFHLNPLEVKDPAHRELIASGIVSIFYKLYAHSWGPRLEYILRNTILTLVSKSDSTLLEVPLILSNDIYRQKIVDRLSDQVLKNFWKDEYNRMSPNLRSEAIAPILNKVGQFLSSNTIRNIIGAPQSTIDLEDVMNNGKVLIMNLSQGKLGEDNSALLGAMLITKLQLAAMNRVNVLEHQRRDFYLYVDEFQNFATNSFIKILSEARKYRLNLTLANQYTAQVSEDVRKAIFGNVGTLMAFLVGADDSSALSKEFGGVYEEDDLVSLGNFQIVLKLAIDNLTSTPFPALTLPLPKSRTQSREKILKVSAERYTKPIEVVQNQQQPEQPKNPPIFVNQQHQDKRLPQGSGKQGSEVLNKQRDIKHPFTGRAVMGQGVIPAPFIEGGRQHNKEEVQKHSETESDDKSSFGDIPPVVPLAGPRQPSKDS